MLCANSLPKYFWVEAINTACFIINCVMIRLILKKTPYKLWKRGKSNVSFFHAFGCKYFVHNNGKDNLGKFDSKSDEAIFLRYSSTSKTFRVFNKHSLVVEESVHVAFDKSYDFSSKNIARSDDEGIEDSMKNLEIAQGNKEPHKKNLEKEFQLEVILPQLESQGQGGDNLNLPRGRKYVHNHVTNLIIGDPSKG